VAANRQVLPLGRLVQSAQRRLANTLASKPLVAPAPARLRPRRQIRAAAIAFDHAIREPPASLGIGRLPSTQLDRLRERGDISETRGRTGREQAGVA